MKEKLFDLIGLLSRTMEDTEIAKEIIECYLEESPITISKLQAAIENSDLNECREKSHELKGSSASVGAIKVQEIAAEIQKESENLDLIKVTALTEDLINTFNKTMKNLSQLELMQ